MPDAVLADTNLFLRYITNDDEQQADAVERVFQRAVAGDLILVVNDLIIAEMIWVLDSYYALPRDTIRGYILSLMNTPGIQIISAELINQAIDIYASKNIDFVDAYSICWMQANNISTVYTFDHRHFSRVLGINVKVPK